MHLQKLEGGPFVCCSWPSCLLSGQFLRVQQTYTFWLIRYLAKNFVPEVSMIASGRSTGPKLFSAPNHSNILGKQISNEKVNAHFPGSFFWKKSKRESFRI